MATIDISEYIDTSNGNLVEPPIAHSTHELSDEPIAIALHRQTRAVRLIADRDCRVAIGPDPAAPKWPLRAGEAERRIITPGERFSVYAVLAEAGPGRPAANAVDDALALIAMASDPKRFEAALKKFAFARTEAEAACAQYRDLKMQSVRFAKERSAFEQERTTERQRLLDLAHEFETLKQAHDVALIAHAAATAKLKADQDTLDAARREFESTIAEVTRIKRLLAA